MERIKAIRNHKGLCWKCLKDDKDTRTIKIPALGYGSSFDCCAREVHLCPKCYEESKDLWGLKVIRSEDYYEEYENEDKIIEFLDNLPPEGRQFVFNKYEDGIDVRPLPPQVWMDYFVNKCLPHSQAKKYGMYSLEEIAAYKEQFPKCVYPVNRVYEDGSVSCWCPFGAYGDKDQKAGLNISEKCYKCKHYRKRNENEKIKDIPNVEWYDYEIKMKYYELDEK